MAQKIILIDAGDIPGASRALDREFEQLEMSGKRVIKIHYPPSLAVDLGVAELRGEARYRGREAVPHHVVPDEIIIDYED